MPMAMTLHELKYGTMTAEQGMKMRDEGSCRIRTILTVDSTSLWSAIAAMVVKIPTEKNLAVHMFWLKEHVECQAINVLRWSDTRDMTADGHTKGSIDRDGILQVMAGQQTFKHEVKRYTPHREVAANPQ